MSVMTASRRKKKSIPPTADRHTEPKEAFHLSPQLKTALEVFVERSRPKTSKSEVLRVALEDYLAEHAPDLWPGSAADPASNN